MSQTKFSSAMNDNSCQYKSSNFLICAILNGMRQFLSIILIYISMVIHGNKMFFICWLANFLSSLNKCLFIFPLHILWNNFGYFCWSLWVYYIAWIVLVFIDRCFVCSFVCITVKYLCPPPVTQITKKKRGGILLKNC